jgi:hypothetical protein
MEAPKGDAIEIDELCVRKKGSLWLWIARSRKTGQVLAAVLGDRSWAMLERLWSRVPLSYRRKLVYTDTGTEGASAAMVLTKRSSLPGSTGSRTSAMVVPVVSRVSTPCGARAFPV